jgi:hypothetical protein
MMKTLSSSVKDELNLLTYRVTQVRWLTVPSNPGVTPCGEKTPMPSGYRANDFALHLGIWAHLPLLMSCRAC